MTTNPEHSDRPEIPKFREQINEAVPADFRDIEDQYNKKLTQLFANIDENGAFEPHEKIELKNKVSKMLRRALLESKHNLANVPQSERIDRLATEGTKLIDTFQSVITEQSTSAKDWGGITNEEFAEEIYGPLDYSDAGIPEINTLFHKAYRALKDPKAAMQSAITTFFKKPENQTYTNFRIAKSRFPNLQLPPMQFTLVNVQKPENLRDLQGRIVRKAKIGENFVYVSPLPNRGRYTYARVEDENGNSYMICTNDAGSVALQTVTNGEKPQALEHPTDPSNPNEEMINSGLSDTEGVLLAAVNQMQIQDVIPTEVQKAQIILRNTFNGPKVPLGVPLTIVRKNGTFHFTGGLANLGRVKIYAGDRILLHETKQAAETLAEKTSAYPSIQQMLNAARQNWMGLNVLPRAFQDKAKCGGYVGKLLEGIFGRAFIERNGLFDRETQLLSDAWMIPATIEQSGYAKTAVDMSSYFQVDHGRKRIRLDSSRPGYEKAVDNFIESAFQDNAQLGLALFHYKHTATNPTILANLRNGGSLNSHATAVMGNGVRRIENRHQTMSPADLIITTIQERLGRSYDNEWKKNRRLLKHLRDVRHNNRPLVFSHGDFVDKETGQAITVKTGDLLTYGDIQIADFYHNPSRPNESPARMNGLVELMIQGNLEPVKLMTWDQKKVETQLTVENNNFITAYWTVGSEINSSETLQKAIIDIYNRSDRSFKEGNPDREAYVRRTMNFYKVTRLVSDVDGLPAVSAKLPILNWSAKETPEKIAARRRKQDEQQT